MIKINKEKEYESHGFTFKNFVMLTLEEKLKILEWRNSDKVRQVMVNKEIITENDHLKFIESLKERDDCYYWLVKNKNGDDIGVLDVIHIDEVNDVGEIGYYLNPLLIGMGLEFVVECEFFVYGVVELGNNIATVDVDNKAALLLNSYLGDTYEGVKTIDGITYFYNNHCNGDYLIEHYSEFNLKSYLKYMVGHKDIINEIKDGIKPQKK